MLERHAELLRADAWIFGDGPVHQSGRLQVVFGVRGVMGLELTTYGPSRALHSGHYGNWAPNPIALMTELLAGLARSYHLDPGAVRAAARQIPVLDARKRAQIPAWVQSVASTFAEMSRERAALVSRLRSIAAMTNLETAP